MAATTGIAWTDSTFNPWIGCTKISPACDHCYAERDFDLRRHVATWGAGQPRKRTGVANWKQVERWNAKPFYECDCGWRGEEVIQHIRDCSSPQQHQMKAARRRVFCASLGDVFDNEVDPLWRADLFHLIRITPNLDWLLLTKRPQNIVRMVQSHGAIAGNGTRYLPDNVLLGTTCEDQKHWDSNVPALLHTREKLGARALFVSIEPMLGHIDCGVVGNRMGTASGAVRGVIDWVICGGESGAKARPMHPDWARSLRDQCSAAGVPFLFKQWGEWATDDVDDERTPIRDEAGVLPNGDVALMSQGYIPPFDDGERLRAAGNVRLDGRTLMCRVGVKRAGRLLDGREHNEFPKGGM